MIFFYNHECLGIYSIKSSLCFLSSLTVRVLGNKINWPMNSCVRRVTNLILPGRILPLSEFPITFHRGELLFLTLQMSHVYIRAADAKGLYSAQEANGQRRYDDRISWRIIQWNISELKSHEAFVSFKHKDNSR